MNHIIQTRHRASTSIHVTTPRSMDKMEWHTQQACRFYRRRGESSPACVVRAACAGPGGLPLGSATQFHSNATRALIANPPNSAQLGGISYHSAKLHPGPCNSVAGFLQMFGKQIPGVFQEYFTHFPGVLQRFSRALCVFFSQLDATFNAIYYIYTACPRKNAPKVYWFSIRNTWQTSLKFLQQNLAHICTLYAKIRENLT